MELIILWLYVASVLLAFGNVAYTIFSEYHDDVADSGPFYQLTYGNAIVRVLTCLIPFYNFEWAKASIESLLDRIEEHLNIPVVRHKRED